MSSTSKSRSRKRRAQLLANGYAPGGEGPRWFRTDDRTLTQKFDDWMLSLLSERVAATLFVLACGLLVFLTIGAVSEFADLRAYANAPTCGASTTTGCRDEVSVTITGVGKTAGKAATYYIDVSGLSDAPTRIQLRDGSGVWSVARDADPAIVELWHGVPVSVTADYVTSDTGDTPHVTFVETASIALVAAAGGAMFGLYWLRRRHYRRSGGERWPARLALLEPAALLATVGMFAGAVFASVADSAIVAAAVDGGLVLLLAGTYLAFNRRGAMTRRR